jgi:hypothetical protein
MKIKFLFMNNKLSINCLILIIAPFFFSCRGPVKDENNASASFLSLRVGMKNMF